MGFSEVRSQIISVFTNKPPERDEVQYQIGDYKSEIVLLYQEIEDPNRSNEFLVECFKRLNLPEQLRPKLKDAKSGYDDFSLLHIAAKTMRAPLCLFLVDEFFFGTKILTQPAINF
jgi:hypothetical protein